MASHATLLQSTRLVDQKLRPRVCTYIRIFKPRLFTCSLSVTRQHNTTTFRIAGVSSSRSKPISGEDLTMETTKMTSKTKSRVMKVVGQKYASVSDLVRDMSEPDFSEEFDKYQADRRLVNCLKVIRTSHGLSQAELAKRMGCAQSKVSKLESSIDADVNFGDVICYALALGRSVFMFVNPAKASGTDQIRFYFECIKHELDRLVTPAGNDTSIAGGVEQFAIETIQNMVTMIETSLEKLPHRAKQLRAAVSVEVSGDRGERLCLDSPSVRAGTRRAVPTS